MKTLRIILLGIIILCVIPLISLILWSIRPSGNLNVLIIDKSVMDARRTKHLALVWNLNHMKFHHWGNKPYSLEQDYYGFLPLKPYKGRNFEVKRIRLSEIDTLAALNDIVYFADTYGVYFNEWFSGERKESGTNQIIGGLNQNDYLLMKKMVEDGKTIIAEHDFFSITSEPLVLKKTQDLLKVHYTGWTGKYYSHLDTLSKQVPQWIIDGYKKMNGGNWSFAGKGIILTRGPSVIVVLQADKYLNSEFPIMRTNLENALSYNLPDSIPFSNWFDITLSDTLNSVFAELELPVNEDGSQVLAAAGVPQKFPIILHYKGSYEFWYFGGDFSESKMLYATYKMRGWKQLKFLHASGPGTQKYFVWNYYIPLTANIFSHVHR